MDGRMEGGMDGGMKGWTANQQNRLYYPGH